MATVCPLPKEEIGNATGIYNLMRNVGGSIGISMVTTLLARHAQAHQAMLLAFVDNCRLMAVLALCCVPIVWLLRAGPRSRVTAH